MCKFNESNILLISPGDRPLGGFLRHGIPDGPDVRRGGQDHPPGNETKRFTEVNLNYNYKHKNVHNSTNQFLY